MAARSRQQRAAFTLVEMLIVMGIVAVLATMTLASYVSITRRNAREGAIEMVMNTLRQARMSAVDSGRGAVVRIDPEARALYGLSRRVEAAWRFEQLNTTTNVTPGARGMHGTVSGAILHQDGALGLCLLFDGTDDSVNCSSYPVYDQTDGVRLEAYVWPQGDGTVLARTDGSSGYSLALAGDELEASFHIRDADGNDQELSLSGGSVRQDRWSHVAAEFDGFEGRLFLRGVLVDLDSFEDDDPDDDPNSDTNIDDPNSDTNIEFTAPAQLRPARANDLIIGDDFTGRIDEPRLLSVAGGDRRQLPPRVPLVTTEEAVYFDSQGYRDLAYHSSDVYLVVGDPYQSADLQNDPLAAGGATITVGPDNPFPAGGGMVLIDGELIRYESASGLDLVINDPTDDEDRGGLGTGAASHQQGSTVYFARVLRVTQTGLVNRVTHDSDDVW
ncbi:MAG: LamG-like jellyroll fold domain-containing protein [Candidatus Brocadiia bacterium]